MTAAQASKPSQPPDAAPRLEMRIRPGVTFPDWSAVSSPRVEQALTAIFEAFGIERCWTDYGEAEDRVRRAILEHYASDGGAPGIAGLSRSTGIDREGVRALLRSLKARDLVVLDEAGETIAGAYPFTERQTEHRVRLGGHVVHAMCAIDALGSGAMYGEDIVIESACRSCGTPIRAETRDRGRALKTFAPEGAVVWSGIEDADGCAASSLCPVIAFFCSDAHLESWRGDNHPGVNGFRLSMEEGRQAGTAIFAPMLAPGSTDD